MDRKSWGGGALSAALFSRPEPYREGLGKTQTTTSRGQGSKQVNSRSGHHRSSPAHRSRQRSRWVQVIIRNPLVQGVSAYPSCREPVVNRNRSKPQESRNHELDNI